MARGAGAATGALVAVVVSVPLLVFGLLASLVIGVPFVPFALFSALTKALPGGLVTRGIETMVAALTALGLSLRETSKLAEQALAVILALGLAVLAGAGLFGVLRARRRGLVYGGVLGIAAGAAAVLAVVTAGETGRVSVAIAGLWALLGGILWGVTLGGAHELLAAAVGPGRGAVSLPAGGDDERALLERRSRREVLVRLGGVSAALTVVGAGLAAVLRSSMQPAEPQGDGSLVLPPVVLPPRPRAVMPAPGTRPEYTPVAEHYRIDIDLRPPAIDGDSWRLLVRGLVKRPRVLVLSDFYQAQLGEPLHRFITLSCISNPIGGDLIGTTRWSGVSLRRLLDHVGARPEARFVSITSVDGFHESVPVQLAREDPRVMLAYAWDGRALPREHGFPLRVYVPDRYGMKQPKWITGIELVADERPGYWVERGWDPVARMRTTSVIDTVAVDHPIERGGRVLVPVGGIAHAGTRGISRVEVQVDGREWRPAALRPPLSDLTWVLWRYDWPFEAGTHTFAVRCFDGAGIMQVLEPHPPHPSGSTGVSTVTASVERG